MAVAFDVAGQINNTSSKTTSLSGSVTIGSMTNGALVVAFVSNNNLVTGMAVTWGGVAMTAIGSTLISDVGAGVGQLFGLVNPGGGTKTLAATWTTSGSAILGYTSFSGVNQTGGATTFLNGATKNNAGTSASTSLAITTASGDATICSWVGGLDFTGTQTPAVDWQHNVIGDALGEGQHILSPASSDNYVATISATDVIVGSGARIKAAAGGAAAIVARAIPVLQAVQRASNW